MPLGEWLSGVIHATAEAERAERAAGQNDSLIERAVARLEAGLAPSVGSAVTDREE